MDFARVNLLLSVVHSCAAYGPRFGNIVKAAEAELQAINSGDTVIPEVEEAEPMPTTVGAIRRL